MSNILNHNRNIFDVKLDMSNYYDFHISLDENGYSNENECLISFIDTNDSECVWFDEIYSKPNISWPESKNNGIILNSIGYTGVDNGLIQFNKYGITNEEFLNIFIKSSYKIDLNNTRLTLHKVNGNNQVYSYENELIYDSTSQVVKLNGGFYQGFYKVGNDYQVLPNDMDKSPIHFYIRLCKKDFINENYTLNKKHPENKGIFLFIGTRSENKWWKYYNVTDRDCIIFNEDYFENYLEKDKNVNENYFSVDDVECENYFGKDYFTDILSNCQDTYSTEYVMDDIKIDDKTKLYTSEGYNLYQPNITEFKTDNKFISYNQTKDGLKTCDENVDVIVYDIKTPNMENYFTLFDQTKNGYTTQTIDKLISVKNKEYTILEDLYNNAIAFQIKDDGSIGYKYLVKDCENNTYKILSEFSKPNNIKLDSWYDVDVKIVPYPTHMIITIYINNKLVLYSKELPKLNFRELDDLSSKQEGIPFNISLGGGTQGLADTININYMEIPNTILPIEKEFAGSFIGYINEFKIFYC